MQKHFTLTLGFSLLLLLFSTLFCAIVAEWIHISINEWTLPIGYLAAMCIISALHIRNRRSIDIRLLGKLFASVLLIVALSLLLGGYAYDYAYDGMSYHQPIIRSLMYGWNPIYESHCPYTAEWLCSSYVDHYPKAIETLCAAFATFAGNIEYGKAVNLLLIISSFCFANSFIETYLAERYSKSSKTLLALLLTLSPVTLSQVFTFYVDFTLYAYLLIGFSCLYLHTAHKSSGSPPQTMSSHELFFIITMLVSLSIGTKVIAAFWVIMFFLVALFIFGIRRKKREVRSIIQGMLCGGLLGLFVFSYHPYITHLQQGRHMLHPFMGSEAVNVENLQAETLPGSNRVEAVVKSLFSRPNETHPVETKSYFPRVQNIVACGKADVRMGGGGILFIEMLIMVPILLLLSWRISPKSTLCPIGIIVALVAALFVLPNGWWFRFTPFTYLIPLCAFLHYLKLTPQQGSVMKWCVSLIMIVNISVIAIVSLSLMQMHRSKMHYLSDVLKQSPTVRIQSNNHTFVHQIKEQGFNCQYVSTAPRQLIFPGPPVYSHREDWNTHGLNISNYPLLRWSNISQDIFYP